MLPSEATVTVRDIIHLALAAKLTRGLNSEMGRLPQRCQLLGMKRYLHVF